MSLPRFVLLAATLTACGGGGSYDPYATGGADLDGMQACYDAAAEDLDACQQDCIDDQGDCFDRGGDDCTDDANACLDDCADDYDRDTAWCS